MWKVNAAEPEETDVLAFLNRALEGIWNYGARLNSPVLLKHEVFASDSGTVKIPGGAMKVMSVHEHSSGDLIPRASHSYATTVSENGCRCCVAHFDQVDIYPLSEPVVADIVYIPSFAKLKERTDELPFSPELDNAIIAMVVGMMGGAEADELMSRARYGNAVSRYFRPSGPDAVICRGPW